MSDETLETLRTNTIQGYGVKAWHYQEGVSAEPYPDAVPEEVVGDLFPRILEVAVGYDHNGWTESEAHKALVRDDTGGLLSITNESYQPHQYADTLLGMGLPIATAGLLKEGRVAWVQYGTADTVTTPENVTFVPKLLTATSADGSMSTVMKHVVTLAVCDNTLAIALGEGSGGKVRHTRYSVPRVDTMRQAFGMLPDVADVVSAGIATSTSTKVTDKQIADFLDELLPATAKGSDVEGRALTIATNKRDAINDRLYGMWSDYSDTQFGLLQAVDTAARWDFRTTDEEKVMAKTIAGDFDKGITEAGKILAKVLA